MMRLTTRQAAALALLSGLLLAVPQLASATPVVYGFTGGSVTISATTGATTLLVAPGVPLTGTSVTFDDAVPALTDIQLAIAAAGPFTLLAPYAGFTTVSIMSVALSPAPGYTGPANLVAPGNYTYAAGPVKVTGLVTASPPPTGPIPFNIVTPSATGTILVNSTTGNISLLGITIGVVPAFGGEPFPLVIKGDFFFRGVIPEPGTAILLGAGLLGIFAAGRRARRS